MLFRAAEGRHPDVTALTAASRGQGKPAMAPCGSGLARWERSFWASYCSMSLGISRVSRLQGCCWCRLSDSRSPAPVDLEELLTLQQFLFPQALSVSTTSELQGEKFRVPGGFGGDAELSLQADLNRREPRIRIRKRKNFRPAHKLCTSSLL